jgi:bifunctional N-acetylglucosamine-1-phosphate-uridyltransferase/glucosamine-1-phosphate-acetyltransferase GlmU-like protein
VGGATSPTVVILAAGSGSRFGGLKQLVEVAADGAAIMDILIERSAAAGVGRAVIVVAPGMEAVVRAHVDTVGRAARAQLPVEMVVQPMPPGRARPLGTADAVLAARGAIDGPFVVVNADDLYPADAFGMLVAHLRAGPHDEHAMVVFRVRATLTARRPVSRALVDVDVDAAAALVAIREGTVICAGDGLRFESGSAVQPLRGDEYVSMNMWALQQSAFDALADAVGAFVAERTAGEIFLPDVVGSMVASGATVRVFVSESSCVGVTHREDVAVLRAMVS